MLFWSNAYPPLHGNRRPPSSYRIALVGGRWHVTRPHATMDHAFGRLEEAEAFVRYDSSDEVAFVELIVGTLYMFKRIRSAG